MSGIRKRAVETDHKKTYQGVDRVTVLGLVCERMTERVELDRQEQEDRRVRQDVCMCVCVLLSLKLSVDQSSRSCDLKRQALLRMSQSTRRTW
jgi:hypothetical protein